MDDLKEEKICHEEKQNDINDQKEDKRTKKEKKSKEKQIIKDLEEQISDLEGKLKYTQAEMINFRKRKEEESVNMLKFANQDLIVDLLPVIDNFERATKMDDNTISEELSKFLEGFKMMYEMLKETLKRYGIEEINPLGEIFDPNTQEALMSDTSEKYKDEEVIEVLLKGYKLKNRVIRPASVKINKK